MAKKLKLWNGGGAVCRNPSDPRWGSVPPNGATYAYIAAYSRADECRVIKEYCGRAPRESEIKTYWQEDLWGTPMEGITPERGLWLSFDRQSVVRVV